MADTEDEVDVPPSLTTKSPGGPIIEQSQESEEYQKALQTVVGTALGVILLVGILALVFLLYRLRRQRRRAAFGSGSQQHSPILQRSISLDVSSKPVPTVLVLYAYDCAVHEAVVVAVAGLLMEVCGVTVSLDVLEEAVILEQGLEDWLEDRLQEADFILVICSLGARLRCSKKRARFRQEANRPMPDYFAVAVDYVAEKLRVERSKGLGVGKFVTVVMDYSRLSDIPPQLEAATSFSLMRDFNALCAHLSTTSPQLQWKPPGEGEGEGEGWQQTESGAELWAAVGQARNYFRAHPNWLEDRLEPMPPRPRAKPRRRRHHDRQAPATPMLPLLPMADPATTSRSLLDVNSSGNNAVVHLHGLSGPRPAASFAQSRQNSLPSSLCSSHPPAPPVAPTQQSVSRSVDSFPPPLGQDFGGEGGEGSTCLLCQQQRQGWGTGRGRIGVRGGRGIPCHLHGRRSHHGDDGTSTLSDPDGDSDLELGVEALDERCSRSQSLPSVGLPLTTPTPFPTSHTTGDGFANVPAFSALSRSRTVLHAEVHKEWGANRDGESLTGRGEPATHPLGLFPPPAPAPVPVPDDGRVWDVWGPGPKDWSAVQRSTHCVSPASVSSDSSGSSYSGGHSGSDSLERDLRSLTVPRIFDPAADCSYLGRLYGSAPPRSLSSSVLLTADESRLRPLAPCLTPSLAPTHATPAHFTFDLSPFHLEADPDTIHSVSDSPSVFGSETHVL